MIKPFIAFLMVFSFQNAQASIPERWKNLLQELVQINSSTSNEEGLNSMRSKLIPEFEALGFKKTIKDVGAGHKVLSFHYPDGKPKVILIGHLDTVFDKKSPFQKFVDKGASFHGPGVNDMKGGIVLMLMVLNELKDTGLLSSIAIVLNDDEEIGSPHSANELKKVSRGIPYGLIYEPTLASSEHVTTTQAGVEWLEVKVKGRASHAGAEHEKGINACVELAHKITEISKLTSYKKKLTVNPGVIQGGTKPNVVCEEASVKLDIRYVEEKDLKDFRIKLNRIVAKSTIYNQGLKKGTEASVVEIVHIPSLPESSTKMLFDKGTLVAKRLGFTLKKEHLGGASDANQLAPTGMQLLGGLGPLGKNAHSEDEMMDVESLERRKNFSLELLKEILE